MSMKHQRNHFCSTVLLLGVLAEVCLVSSLSSSSSPLTFTSSLHPGAVVANHDHSEEIIGSLGFHHVEFYCGDARSTATRFSLGLGLQMVGSTGQHTGNDQCVSYGLQSGQVRILLTAPYSQKIATTHNTQRRIEKNVISTDDTATSTTTTTTTPPIAYEAPHPLPGFSIGGAHEFFVRHGLAVRALALEVRDVPAAFTQSVRQGAIPVLEPTYIPPCRGQTLFNKSWDDDVQEDRPTTRTTTTTTTTTPVGCTMAEVELYGDVVLRYISFDNDPLTIRHENLLPFLPHLHPMKGMMGGKRPSFGLQRFDHAVGNVPDLRAAQARIAKFTGFHEFAEFTPEDVGTIESGLNSVVLASDSENILLPLNEPTEGKRKSQIQTFLEQNEGPGLQHLALKTDDIFKTVALMRQAEEELGGFELMRRPSDQYYKELPDRLGSKLTAEHYQKLEELGILADADDEGILLQIFTKPIGDRPTFFFEIIQRIGCQYTASLEGHDTLLERPGCGGFGRGNFRELFKSIEDYEKTLKV